MKVAVVTGIFAIVAAIVGSLVAFALSGGSGSSDSSKHSSSSPLAAGSNPAPSSAVHTEPPTTPPIPVQRTAYLADLPIVEQRIGEPGPATIAGTPYVHSVILDPDNIDQKAWADFDLGAHYTRLHATVGMLSSDSEGSLAWEVFANGQSIKHGVVGLYKGISLDVNLKGVQRLRISAALIGDFNSLWTENLKLAFGDATLTVDSVNPPIPSPSS